MGSRKKMGDMSDAEWRREIEEMRKSRRDEFMPGAGLKSDEDDDSYWETMANMPKEQRKLMDETFSKDGKDAHLDEKFEKAFSSGDNPAKSLEKFRNSLRNHVTRSHFDLATSHHAEFQAKHSSGDTMIDQVATAGTDIKKNQRDPYGDGDQSLFKNSWVGQPVRDVWASGGDMWMLMSGQCEGEVPDFHRVAFHCRVSHIRKMLAAASDSDTLLSDGYRVKLSGIKSRPLLNGLEGNLERQLPSGRWMVIIDREQNMSSDARKCCEQLENNYQASFNETNLENFASAAGSKKDPKAKLLSPRKKMLEKRMGVLRQSAIFMLILGALYMKQGFIADTGTVEDFVTCAEVMCQAGANVNAKDVMGATIVTMCVGFCRTDASMKMLEVFIKHGVDVNLGNRFNEVPIFEALQVKSKPAFTALLDAGADVHIKSVDRVSPMGALEAWPAMAKVFSEHGCSKTAKNNWKGKHKCNKCGKPSSKNCGACKAVWYCSSTCQKEHWPEHKKECKKLRDRPRDVLIYKLEEHFPKHLPKEVKQTVMTANDPNVPNRHMRPRTHGKFVPPKGKKVGEEFTVKLAPDGFFYDQSRTVNVNPMCIPKEVKDRQADIEKAVEEHGYQGTKAYFVATVQDDGSLKIFLDDPKPLQQW